MSFKVKLDLFMRRGRGSVFPSKLLSALFRKKKSLSTRSASKATLRNRDVQGTRHAAGSTSSSHQAEDTAHTEVYQSWTPEPSSILQAHSDATHSVLLQVHLDNTRWQGSCGAVEVHERWSPSDGTTKASFESNTEAKVTVPSTVGCPVFHHQSVWVCAHELLNKS